MEVAMMGAMIPASSWSGHLNHVQRLTADSIASMAQTEYDRGTRQIGRKDIVQCKIDCISESNDEETASISKTRDRSTKYLHSNDNQEWWSEADDHTANDGSRFRNDQCFGSSHSFLDRICHKRSRNESGSDGDKNE